MVRLRKEQGRTQQQVADHHLDIAQQTLAHYEIGPLRIVAAMLPVLAHALGVTIEELTGEEPKRTKRRPAPRIQQQSSRLVSSRRPSNVS